MNKQVDMSAPLTMKASAHSGSEAVYGRRFGPFGAEYALLPRWSAFERLYIRLFGIVDLPGRIRARIVLQALPHMHAGIALDIGTGTGCYALFLSRNPDVQVYGLDIDPRRVFECDFVARKAGRPNVCLTADSADEALGRIASESVDAVLAVEVLQYCRDVEGVMANACRVLKPGGCLIAHVPVLGYLRPTETMLFSFESLRRIAQDAGLRLCSLEPTFGGAHRHLCRIFERASASRAVTALLFPFLLLASRLIPPPRGSGEYALLHARRP